MEGGQIFFVAKERANLNIEAGPLLEELGPSFLRLLLSLLYTLVQFPPLLSKKPIYPQDLQYNVSIPLSVFFFNFLT